MKDTCAMKFIRDHKDTIMVASLITAGLYLYNKGYQNGFADSTYFAQSAMQGSMHKHF
jgi:hypothetical protein